MDKTAPVHGAVLYTERHPGAQACFCRISKRVMQIIDFGKSSSSAVRSISNAAFASRAET